MAGNTAIRVFRCDARPRFPSCRRLTACLGAAHGAVSGGPGGRAVVNDPLPTRRIPDEGRCTRSLQRQKAAVPTGLPNTQRTCPPRCTSPRAGTEPATAREAESTRTRTPGEAKVQKLYRTSENDVQFSPSTRKQKISQGKQKDQTPTPPSHPVVVPPHLQLPQRPTTLLQGTSARPRVPSSVIFPLINPANEPAGIGERIICASGGGRVSLAPAFRGRRF